MWIYHCLGTSSAISPPVGFHHQRDGILPQTNPMRPTNAEERRHADLMWNRLLPFPTRRDLATGTTPKKSRTWLEGLVTPLQHLCPAEPRDLQWQDWQDTMPYCRLTAFYPLPGKAGRAAEVITRGAWLPRESCWPYLGIHLEEGVWASAADRRPLERLAVVKVVIILQAPDLQNKHKELSGQLHFSPAPPKGC